MKSVIYILLVLPLVSSFNSNCKQEIYLTSPYKFSGTSGTFCEYLMIAPTGSKVNMQCSFYISNQFACIDEFVFSVDGDFSSRKFYYCKDGRFSLVSLDNKFIVGADFRTTESNFTCTAYISTPLTAGQCDCGWNPQSRISGGSVTGINEYPFTALVLHSLSLVTAGTIISPRHVLTTASSLIGKTFSSVLVGDHDLTTGMEAPSTQEYGLQKLSVHPKFNDATKENDIAILHIIKDIKFSPTIGPACLPFNFKNNQFNSNTVIGIGWGGVDAKNANSYSHVLKAANFTVLNNADCQSQLPTKVITANQICSYSTVNDLCKNDAGGPLVYWNSVSGRYVLVGLISHSLQCSPSLPGVHTRLTSYLDWIESETSGTTFCKK